MSIDLAVSTVIFALRTSEDAADVAPGEEAEPAGLSIPLVRRTREPYLGRWALPGGGATESESLADTAARKLFETTQLAPAYLEQLYAFGDVDRSPSGRVVSIVYWALVRGDEAAQTRESENVRWFAADELPDLAFDHNAIVDYALWRLRSKLEYSRIAHAFLGETFTLTRLRQVYEVVLQKPIDPANFRRQVEATRAIVPTGEHVTGGRHRPPRLYRYDTSVELVDNGPLTRTI